MNTNSTAAGGFVRASACGKGNCVEVAALPGGLIGIRDSKDASDSAPVLRFDRAEWESFLDGVVAGEFAYQRLASGALVASA